MHRGRRLFGIFWSVFPLYISVYMSSFHAGGAFCVPPISFIQCNISIYANYGASFIIYRAMSSLPIAFLLKMFQIADSIISFYLSRASNILIVIAAISSFPLAMKSVHSWGIIRFPTIDFILSFSYFLCLSF